MKEGVYSRGIRPGSRNAAPGDATGRPGDQEATGGLGESVGDTAKGGGTGVANGVGGGTAGRRLGCRKCAKSKIKWRHASTTYTPRNPAPAIAGPIKAAEMRDPTRTPT